MSAPLRLRRRSRAPHVASAFALCLLASCGGAGGDGSEPVAAASTTADGWEVDFRDDFDRFDPENWQDQLLWVNDEQQCYVRDNLHGTREVSDGTLKLRVVDLGEPADCDNPNKVGDAAPAHAVRRRTHHLQEPPGVHQGSLDRAAPRGRTAGSRHVSRVVAARCAQQRAARRGGR